MIKRILESGPAPAKLAHIVGDIGVCPVKKVNLDSITLIVFKLNYGKHGKN